MKRRPFLAAILFILLILPGRNALPARENPSLHWESDIGAFEAQDLREGYPDPGVIVFVGSSSIKAWKTLKRDFSPLPVINRGFGGSQIVDATFYADRIVIPYLPSRVVLYSGDNDIAAGKSPDSVAADFRNFVARIRKSIPGEPVYFISIKPSPSRWTLWDKMRAANGMIMEFCNADSLLFYIDTATPMLEQDGRPRGDLFRDDSLHMNAGGYALWTSIIKPYLNSKAVAP